MKGIIYRILLVASAFAALAAEASAQEQNKAPDPQEMAAKEAERLESLLGLEPWQVFYVDSTLQHDYRALQTEMEDLQRAKVENYDLYIQVRDKWAEQIDRAYQRFFNDQQWQKYQKSGAARAQKARDKRRAQAEKAAAKKKK